MSRKEVTEALTKAAIGHWTKKNYCVVREAAIVRKGALRADVIAIHIKREVIVSEVKSSLEDYKTDKKWLKYLKEECFNKFYFVISQELYEDKRARVMLSDIREHEVGLMVLEQKTGLLRTKIKCKPRTISESKLLDIAIRILWRSSLNRTNTRRRRQYI